MPSATIYTHIAEDPGTFGGLPHIAGTRIRVVDIVALHDRGLTPPEILDAYEHLTLGQVHAVLAYYYDHRDEVEKQRAELSRREDEFRRNHPDLIR